MQHRDHETMPALSDPLKRWWSPNVRWTARLSSAGRGPAVLALGKAYVTSGSATLSCLDAANGDVLWTHTADGEEENAGLCSPPVVDLQQETVRYVTAAGRTVSLSWRGEALKRAEDAAPPTPDPSALAHGGLAYRLSPAGVLTVREEAGDAEVYRQSLGEGDAGEGAASQLCATHDAVFATFGAHPARTVIVKPGREFEKLWEFDTEGGPASLSFYVTNLYVCAGDRVYCVGGSVPAEPEAPEPTPVARPIPLAGAVPEGVPIAAFSNDVTIGEWLCAGPFTPNTIDVDFLASLGGAAAAAPKPGTVVRFAPGPAPEEDDPDCAVPVGDAAANTFRRLEGAEYWWAERNKWTQNLDPLELTRLTGAVPLGAEAVAFGLGKEGQSEQ